MIASFFQRLDEHQVEWLLISGQATILYGAAMFSEDVDLWVEPGAENLRRFTAALRASNARYYKLTPALTAEMALRHHGFHFTIPEVSDEKTLFLDVMGYPPRVGDFAAANARARLFNTQWGRLRTVAIPDLVELKKTQRPRDYPIIGRLVLAFVQERAGACSEDELRWAVDNIFTLSEFRRLVSAQPSAVAVFDSHSVLGRAAEQLLAEHELSPALEDELEDWFDQRMAPLRRADRQFWRGVIDELRGLRAAGELMPEGERV